MQPKQPKPPARRNSPQPTKRCAPQRKKMCIRDRPDAGPIRYMIAEPSSGGAPVLINELSDRAFIDRFLGDLHEACYPKPAFSEYRD